ncbi:SDR family NAD(P)-dependent oxidoreductase [Consotaella aegiceratis]|uniref:SDR family NAD(P)-dependent oxidoreductase n=1 Tax=Consotaella aegiceratis TaxID=3097961 RepID=UPI002F42699D
MSASLPLGGQFAVVTGAGEGIGLAIAETLSALGASVTISDRDAAKAEAAAVQRNMRAIKLDVTDRSSIDTAVAAIVAKTGGIDIWCNNAGVSSMQRFVDISEREWDQNFEVNAKGAFLCSQAIARQMLTQERRSSGLRGKIINTASVAGKTGKVAFLAHYIASKFAVVGLTQAMATELAGEGITVNAVCPGYVRTSMQTREIAWEAELRGISEKDVQALYIKDTPLGRIETPQDVAGVVGFLASPQADFMTGIALTVSGGAWME